MEMDSIKIFALGRHFQLGTLYDYINDSIIPETLMWDPDEVIELAGSRLITEKNHSIFLSRDPSEDERMQVGMDNHLMVSWMSALIGPFRLGASAYIENRWLLDSTHCCLHIRTLYRKEKLDYELAKNNLEIVCNPAIVKQGRASHVVTAVTYGLDTYCVFELEQDDISDLEREEVVELLKEAANQFRDGLDQQKDPPIFENVIVWLFADWNKTKQPLRLSYMDAFRRCQDELFSTSIEETLGIPLTVWLCPVNQIVSIIFPNKCQSISSETINKSLELFTQLIRIQMKVGNLIQHPSAWDHDSLNLFYKLLMTFRKRVQSRMAELVQNFRAGRMDGDESNFSRIISIVNSSVFNPDVLSNWIERQLLWIRLANYTKKTLPDVSVCKNVRNADIGDGLEPILILQLPLLLPVRDSLLVKMNDYIRNNVKLVRSSCESDPPTSLEAICLASARLHLALPSICRFAHFISENKSSTKSKYLIVVHGDADPRFRLYYNESMEDYVLSHPTADFKIVENRHGKLTLAWNMDGFVNVTNFLVEYRRSCDSSWTRITSGFVGQIQLTLTQREQYYFRVATETLAGRSDFTRSLGPESISSICNPPGGIICTLATENAIKIRWADPRELDPVIITLYQLEYWSECDESSVQKRTTTEKECKLDNLKKGTTYLIRVAAVCGTEGTSAFSPSVRIATLMELERVALIVKEASILANGSPDPATGSAVYNVPLRSADEGQINRRIFGSPNLNFQHKTILVVGATGAGKTTLINAMINYILGVEWDDEFRFQLIQEETVLTEGHSQTNSITAYDVFRTRGSRLDYSLTIVDTPGFGDTRGLEQDSKIREQIRQYFNHSGGIQQLEAVCLVVPATLPRLTPTQLYIFDSILAIFGNDIRDNIRLMATFGDNNEPLVLDSIKEANICPLDSNGQPLYHKFNSSSFFSQKGNPFTPIYFSMSLDNFKEFFQDLQCMKTTSLTLTREVLDKRKRLEVLVEGLQQRLHVGLVKIEELKQTGQALELANNSYTGIILDPSTDFQFDVDCISPEKKDVSGTGHLSSNCPNCNWTCHYPCDCTGDDCFAVDGQGNCLICPGHCSYQQHSKENYKWEQLARRVQRSLETVRLNYQFTTFEEMKEQMSKESTDCKKELLRLVDVIYPLFQRLDKIALRPHPFSAPDYIDLIIAAERSERRSGYLTRIETLEKLRQTANIISRLTRGWQLQNLNDDDDDDSSMILASLANPSSAPQEGEY